MSLIKLITGLVGTNLSLNYQKSNYVLINKVSQKSISAPFTLTINKALVERKKAVKYLGLYIDKNLSWSSHIKELSLKLARSSAIFYKLRKFVSIDTLRTVPSLLSRLGQLEKFRLFQIRLELELELHSFSKLD